MYPAEFVSDLNWKLRAMSLIVVIAVVPFRSTLELTWCLVAMRYI